MKVNPERRKEWLRALRQFKYGMRVRAKLGVLQTICEQVRTERKGKRQWDAPQWEHDHWITFLYTCIRDNKYPPELLTGFAKTAEVTFLRMDMQPSVAKTLDAVDIICKRLSKPLRQKFGVFE